MNVIPCPKMIESDESTVYIGGWNIVMNPLCDSRIFKACQTLKAELEKETSVASKINKAFGAENMTKCISICAGNEENSEKYTLVCTEDAVRISAPSLAGAFYGIQTLRQLLRSSDGRIALCNIEDEPDMAHRGFYHDVSRGRVPTVDGVIRSCHLAGLRTDGDQHLPETGCGGNGLHRHRKLCPEQHGSQF